MKAASPVSLLSPDCLCAVWSRTDVQSSGSRRKRARHRVQTAGRRRMVCLVLVRLEGVVSESPCLPVSLLCDTTGSGEPASCYWQSLSDPSPAKTPIKGRARDRPAQTGRWWARRRQRGDNTPSHEPPGSLACLVLEGQSLPQHILRCLCCGLHCDRRTWSCRSSRRTAFAPAFARR